jgi:hypothetical protein
MTTTPYPSFFNLAPPETKEDWIMEWNAYNKSPKERSEAVRNYKKWAHEKYLESMAEEKAHRHRNSSAEVNKRLQEDNRKRQAAYDERKRLEKEERLKEKEKGEPP